MKSKSSLPETVALTLAKKPLEAPVKSPAYHLKIGDTYSSLRRTQSRNESVDRADHVHASQFHPESSALPRRGDGVRQRNLPPAGRSGVCRTPCLGHRQE